ncbi:hypothetical protein CASFOL_023156 [Castilleja foliolosa]|uniref:DCD domain-containing protein n=1 Tax=Castilleja foliolosa TaxID=1961234 RepID=A0ABD3CL15_9LAMI
MMADNSTKLSDPEIKPEMYEKLEAEVENPSRVKENAASGGGWGGWGFSPLIYLSDLQKAANEAAEEISRTNALGGDVVLARQCIKSIISGDNKFFAKNEIEPRTGSSGIFLKRTLECKKCKGESRFPAQVRISVRKFCNPLEEDAFRPVLHHYDGPKFRLELSVPEVNIGLARSV